jgi:hypothetical protein
MQGVPIFICHRPPEWKFSAVQGVPTEVLLCGNDHISNQIVYVKRNPTSQKSVVAQALEVLALELGLSSNDLVENMVLDSFDQVKSVAISRRIHKETGLGIDMRTFIDYPTLGSFKDYIQNKLSA